MKLTRKAFLIVLFAFIAFVNQVLTSANCPDQQMYLKFPNYLYTGVCLDKKLATEVPSGLKKLVFLDKDNALRVVYPMLYTDLGEKDPVRKTYVVLVSRVVNVPEGWPDELGLQLKGNSFHLLNYSLSASDSVLDNLDDNFIAGIVRLNGDRPFLLNNGILTLEGPENQDVCVFMDGDGYLQYAPKKSAAKQKDRCINTFKVLPEEPDLETKQELFQKQRLNQELVDSMKGPMIDTVNSGKNYFSLALPCRKTTTCPPNFTADCGQLCFSETYICDAYQQAVANTNGSKALSPEYYTDCTTRQPGVVNTDILLGTPAKDYGDYATAGARPSIPFRACKKLNETESCNNSMHDCGDVCFQKAEFGEEQCKHFQEARYWAGKSKQSEPYSEVPPDADNKTLLSVGSQYSFLQAGEYPFCQYTGTAKIKTDMKQPSSTATQPLGTINLL
jgi:hypothetical protein